MSSSSRPICLAGRAALAALAAGASACPGGFVDPNPPVLQRVERLWTPPVEDEPVVYAVLLDLHLARGLDCAAIRSSLVSQVRALMLPAGRPGAELPLVDVSPGCRQAPDRHFDPAALDASIRGAEATFGAARVRAVLLYVNDVDLEVPQSLLSDFAGLRIAVSQRGAPLPVMWAVALGRGKDATLFERLVDWRHSADPGMFAALGAVAGGELPLERSGLVDAGAVPLFSAGEAAGVVELKGCGPPDARISLQGFSFDGQATTLDPARPPGFLFDAPQAPPVMRSAFSARPVRFWVETCSAHCDRYVRLDDGSVAAWDQKVGCTLPAGSGP